MPYAQPATAPAQAGAVAPRSPFPPGCWPTPEQLVIAQHAISPDRSNGVIVAGAGTGKTTTLNMVGTLLAGRNATYLAFNKAIAMDAAATFPPNVNCRTGHSLAWQAVGVNFAGRLDSQRVPARFAASILRLPPVVSLGAKGLTAVRCARLVMDTLGVFYHSDDLAPNASHLKDVPGLEGEMPALREALMPFVHAAWEDVQQPSGRLSFSHDAYLKIWALGNPTIGGDLIFLDEAQDANPVLAQVIAAQQVQKIMVGDPCQAIYGWRGAVDAMDGFDGVRMPLTQSWRFGPELAAKANAWLDLLGSELVLSGNPQRTTTIGPVDPREPYAVLTRTNAGAITEIISAIGDGHRVALVGGDVGIRELAKACRDLQGGKGTEYRELMAFSTWKEVQEYAEAEARDLKVFVKLVDTYGPGKLIELCDSLFTEAESHVRVSTAHKAKGREFDQVRISGDFGGDPYDETGALNVGEAMLSYVAITRAKYRMDLGNLDLAPNPPASLPAPAMFLTDFRRDELVQDAPVDDMTWPATTVAPIAVDIEHGGPDGLGDMHPGRPEDCTRPGCGWQRFGSAGGHQHAALDGSGAVHPGETVNCPGCATPELVAEGSGRCSMPDCGRGGWFCGAHAGVEVDRVLSIDGQPNLYSGPDNVLVPDPEPIGTDMPPRIAAYHHIAVQAAANQASWKEVREDAERRIKDWMTANNLDKATMRGVPAVTWTENKAAEGFDHKALREAHPEIYEQFKTKKAAARPFTLET